MRLLTFCVLVLTLLATAAAQTASLVPAQSTAPTSSTNITADLDRLQSAATQANVDIAHMRIEKWKADADSKRQAQANADSLQRNLTSALPGLIDAFRAQPQNLDAGFKLYRNLNALYDVMTSFTESTGAFGPKNEYEGLAQQLNVVDSVRRDLGDDLQDLTALTQTELNQLRMQVRTLQQAAAAPAETPKKVVVDNSETPKKTVHKKKASTTNSAAGTAAKPAASSSPSTSSKSQ